MTPDQSERLRDHLVALYGEESVDRFWTGFMARLEAFAHAREEGVAVAGGLAVDERDAILITYGDQVQETGRPPLASLGEVLQCWVTGVVSGIHILPFFPYTSDDGFSVVDYHAVDPELGGWAEVEWIAARFRLMADAVINHISASSGWFRGYVEGDERYRDFFISVAEGVDLSAVVRPRALPLLTEVETVRGRERLWTTFSADQVDLNYESPAVLLAMTDVLLDYVAHGAQIIRLDAIAYLWKEAGTPSIHLPQTHRVVQFWRAVLEAVAPGTILITETNVPHAENISYFGDGTNEAQLVYNFPLPPLVLHTFLSGDARLLREWAATLETPSDETTFFNFLASHDGIGVRPVEGLLDQEALARMVERVLAHGGRVSYRHHPDGSQSPYELNINYFDALNDPASDEPLEVQVDRFIASQAILLVLSGVPGIYIHSLFGSRGWPEGAETSGHNRTINRQKFERATLEAELADPTSRRHAVFSRYRALLEARAADPAFHPLGAQRLLPSDPALLALLRTSPGGDHRTLCLVNVSATPQRFSLPAALAGGSGALVDPVRGMRHELGEGDVIPIDPYGVTWLRIEE